MDSALFFDTAKMLDSWAMAFVRIRERVATGRRIEKRVAVTGRQEAHGTTEAVKLHTRGSQSTCRARRSTDEVARTQDPAAIMSVAYVKPHSVKRKLASWR